MSCLEKNPHGNQPAHSEYYYPKKYGYGEIWLRIADTLKNYIIYNQTVKSIDFCNKTVTTLDGMKYKADVIVNTIPWNEFQEFIDMPEKIKNNIRKLRHTSIQTKYFPENVNTASQWTYAYPLNTLEKPRIMQKLLKWCAERDVYALGRWGEHNHYNSDVAYYRLGEFKVKGTFATTEEIERVNHLRLKSKASKRQ